MKKILIYEYITGGGLLNEDLTSSLMNEADIIPTSIYDMCHKSKYFEYNNFRDYRLSGSFEKEAIIIKNKDKIYDLKFLRGFDYVLPILPELNMSLYLYVKYLEKHKINAIISDSSTIELCSDKLQFYKFCEKKSLLSIETYKNYCGSLSGRLILIKDRYGAGCSFIKIITNIKSLNTINNKMVLQPYIEGDDYSISVYFTKHNFYILTINKQIIKFKNKIARLSCIIVNVQHHLHLKIISLMSRIKDVLPGLYGFVGIDIIIKGNDIFIVEINPRLTTSFIGIYDTIGINIIDLIASRKPLKNIISGKKIYIKNYE